MISFPCKPKCGFLSFQLKPQSIFLEAEGSRNVEFPEEGRFKLVDTGPGMKYIVCGDPDTGENAPSVSGFIPSSQPGPSNPSSSGWSIPRPWALLNNQVSLKGNQLSRTKKTLPMSNAAMLKRTFPYVSLSLDHTGKNITVESTIDSVYVKIPESSVCASSILDEVAIRVGSVAEDLVILDAKFLPVSNDERGLCLCQYSYLYHSICLLKLHVCFLLIVALLSYITRA